VQLSDAISASAALFPGFSLSDLPRAGAFVISGGSGPVTGGPTPGDPSSGPIGSPTPDPTPGAATPEPNVVSTVFLAGIAFVCYRRRQRNLRV
jgi:hypothetical protein